MTRRRRLAFLLLVALATAGCSLVEPSHLAVTAPTIVCDAVRIDPPPDLQCEAAALAALEQISQTAVVATAGFHYGAPCAPNMRCAFGVNQGYVVLRLVDGRCGYVTVAMEPAEAPSPRISVSAIEAWPPPEWLEMGVPANLDCQ